MYTAADNVLRLRITTRNAGGFCAHLFAPRAADTWLSKAQAEAFYFYLAEAIKSNMLSRCCFLDIDTGAAAMHAGS
jgi:hypothetical protein